MPAVCFYFQVHQPYRLKPQNFFDIGSGRSVFDDNTNRQILNKVADKCYLPANRLMLQLIRKFSGKFKISYSISGIALEQFEQWRPDVLESFQELAQTGCVEFLAETYYHSLAFLFSEAEFKHQVTMHTQKIQQLFKQTPLVFRNTELQYNNALAQALEGMGYKAVLADGIDQILQGRSPNFIYKAPGVSKIKTLLKNYRLSDDIAFRFSDRNWVQWPLNSEKFAAWMHALNGNAESIHLFMDYETFGEHQWPSTGIFQFMEHLPGQLLVNPDYTFKTLSETIASYEVRDVFDVPDMISWADMERDLSAWLGNPMQNQAIAALYSMEANILKAMDATLMHEWRKLQTSDHFYYMTTKYWSDGDVHKYFSPFQSPHEAYLSYMTALSDFSIRLADTGKKQAVAQ